MHPQRPVRRRVIEAAPGRSESLRKTVVRGERRPPLRSERILVARVARTAWMRSIASGTPRTSSDVAVTITLDAPLLPPRTATSGHLLRAELRLEIAVTA